MNGQLRWQETGLTHYKLNESESRIRENSDVSDSKPRLRKRKKSCPLIIIDTEVVLLPMAVRLGTEIEAEVQDEIIIMGDMTTVMGTEVITEVTETKGSFCTIHILDLAKTTLQYTYTVITSKIMSNYGQVVSSHIYEPLVNILSVCFLLEVIQILIPTFHPKRIGADCQKSERTFTLNTIFQRVDLM